MDERFGGIPNGIRDGLLWIDAQQVLQDRQERYFLRSIHNLT